MPPANSVAPASGAVTGSLPFPAKCRDALVLLGTVLATAALYANSLGNGFIDFDDPENIVDNYAIRDLTWTNLQHWFSTPLQFMYTPLVNLSYALDYQVGGLDPAAYHRTNLLLHLGNVVLVFLVFRLLTGRSFIAHLVAAGFAIHPVNVDAVSWIAARSSLLSSFFFLGALLLYLVHARGGRWWWLAAAVPVFALSALSKSPAVVLPLVLLLADHYLRRPPSWRLLLEKLPFFAISLVIGLVGLHFRSDQTVPYHDGPLQKAFLICSSLVAYLVKFVVPYPLAFAYRYPAQLPWYLCLSPLLLAALVWALYRLARDARAVTFGLGFFAITIVLSQAVLLIDNFRSNRYAYLPFLGLFLIAAVLLERLRGRPAGRVLLVAVPALVFGMLTVQRNALWVDTVSILSDSIAHEPDVPFTYTNRGISEYKAGNDTAALADFETTLRLDHESQLAYYYRGLIKFGRRDYQGAIADYDQAIARSNVFSAAYSDRGRARRELKDYRGALADYDTAISLNGYFADAFFNRGIVRHDLGDDRGAVADYSRTLAYSPGFPEAYNDRGSARLGLGDPAGALADFDRAIALDATYADAWFNRGQTRMSQGDTSSACTDWRQAGQLGSTGAAELVTKHCPAS